MLNNMVEAIVQYGASDKLTCDAWRTLVLKSDECIRTGEDLRTVLKNAEKEFKDTVKKQLPSAWRSAKSVVLKAYEKGVPVIVNNEVIGKSAVEKACKTGKLPKSADELFSEALSTVEALIVKEEDEARQKAFVFMLKELANKLGE